MDRGGLGGKWNVEGTGGVGGEAGSVVSGARSGGEEEECAGLDDEEGEGGEGLGAEEEGPGVDGEGVGEE